MKDLIDVTQEDREAAKHMDRQDLLACYHEEFIDRGDYDHVPAIQQFARHRVSSTAALQQQLEEARVAMERAATLIDRYLYRQHEKLEDVPRMLRKAREEML
jgi:phage gp36-like protein